MRTSSPPPPPGIQRPEHARADSDADGRRRLRTPKDGRPGPTGVDGSVMDHTTPEEGEQTDKQNGPTLDWRTPR